MVITYLGKEKSSYSFIQAFHVTTIKIRLPTTKQRSLPSHLLTMCNDIYTWYLDCGCSIYQNTFECHVARRCQATDGLTLRETVPLPAPPPRIPPGLLSCKRNAATRPVWGECPACRRPAAKGADALKKKKKTKKRDGMQLEVPKAGGALVLPSSNTTSTLGSGIESSVDTSGK